MTKYQLLEKWWDALKAYDAEIQPQIDLLVDCGICAWGWNLVHSVYNTGAYIVLGPKISAAV